MPGLPGERMDPMKKAFAITGLVLGISAIVAAPAIFGQRKGKGGTLCPEKERGGRWI